MSKGLSIAILTNHMEMNPGFSLTGIIEDQIRMLHEYGHDVHLYVNSGYNDKTWPISPDIEGKFTLHKKIPFAHLIDYKSEGDVTEEHKDIIHKTKTMLIEEMQDVDVIFTHDFIFQGWFMIYGMAVKQAAFHLEKPRWLHWIHSIPTAHSDWWNIRSYGEKHRIVYPNRTDRILVAEQYRGEMSHVRTIKHIKDLRSWEEFGTASIEFIKKYPALMKADVVQVYPAAADRLKAKRVMTVMNIFAKIKQKGYSVCLVIANQWATTKQHKENIDNYKRAGSAMGLNPGEDLIFTSEFQPPIYEVGIPKRFLREISKCANLFIFPTREETFGLVLPEAVLGGVLCVLNKSLAMMEEVGGGSSCGLYFDFGSYHAGHTVADSERYYNDIAFVILGRMKENEALTAKTLHRQKYNWNTVYEQDYLPVMAERMNWK